MGIYRLTSRVLHKGERIIFQQRDSNGRDHQNRRIAIIDGPSFAHHVYYRYIREHNHVADSPDVSYAALNQALLFSLSELSQLGFDIRHIFFDGALPAEKRPTRISRLQKAVEQVAKVRQQYEQQDRIDTHSRDLNAFLQHARREHRLPPPAFLVASMLEALSVSDLAQVTQVIPGEAEVYCVSAANALTEQSEVFIFTNDSDVLVAKVGPHVRVLLLEHLELQRTGGELALQALTFDPSSLAAGLHLQDLTTVAAIMEQDSHCTLETAASMAKSVAGKYASRATTTSSSDSFTSDPSIPLLLRYCNPRISEFINALRDRSSDVIETYLPRLIEDTSRASAWQYGRTFRQLAISVLLDHQLLRRQVHEYDRRGLKIVPRSLDRVEDLSPALQSMGEWLMSQLSALKGSASPWQAIGMCAVLGDGQARGKALTRLQEVTHIMSGKRLRSWSQIHLKAELHAMLYSLKMLQVVLQIDQTLSDDSSDSSETQARGPSESALKGLRQMLETLPSLTVLFELPNVDPRSMQHIVHTFHSLAAAEHGQLDHEVTKKSVAHDERVHLEPSLTEQETRRPSNNPYAVLEDAFS